MADSAPAAEHLEGHDRPGVGRAGHLGKPGGKQTAGGVRGGPGPRLRGPGQDPERSPVDRAGQPDDVGVVRREPGPVIVGLGDPRQRVLCACGAGLGLRRLDGPGDDAGDPGLLVPLRRVPEPRAVEEPLQRRRRLQLAAADLDDAIGPRAARTDRARRPHRRPALRRRPAHRGAAAGHRLRRAFRLVRLHAGRRPHQPQRRRHGGADPAVQGPGWRVTEAAGPRGRGIPRAASPPASGCRPSGPSSAYLADGPGTYHAVRRGDRARPDAGPARWPCARSTRTPPTSRWCSSARRWPANRGTTASRTPATS